MSFRDEIHQTVNRDKHLAHLLGISYDEFMQLQHSGLEEVTDSELQIYKYFVRFDTGNPPHIMDKLDTDHNRTVYFSADEWEQELQQESAAGNQNT